MFDREYLLEGLQAVRASGQANMFDKKAVAQLLDVYGYVDEKKTVINMSSAQYMNLLSTDFSEYLDYGKNS